MHDERTFAFGRSRRRAEEEQLEIARSEELRMGSRETLMVRRGTYGPRYAVHIAILERRGYFAIAIAHSPAQETTVDTP